MTGDARGFGKMVYVHMELDASLDTVKKTGL